MRVLGMVRSNLSSTGWNAAWGSALAVLVGLAVGLVLAPASGWAQEAAPAIDFDTQIRPLLSDRCYKCHGPDDLTREADLRLDTGHGLDTQLAVSSGEPILVPGEAEGSELFRRLLATDSEKMPPEDSGLALSPAEIELVRQWIDQGAKWDRHWSFVPVPTQVARPTPADPQAWIRQPIDAFILQELQTVGLGPAQAAAPNQLLRRLFLDLIGLPPTPAEASEWLPIVDRDGWEPLVDHLLARPEFGQRLASDWLDAARYSDTYGYQVDRERFVWPWRDWVVQAFNQNMPYDQFGTWQLAGDLLPDPTFEQILATTFNRLHPQEVEGGSIEEEFRMKYISDRTETFGMAFLGLTLECCRCHHHKYDPLAQEDYFRLTAFFDNIDEAGLYSYFTDSVPTPTAFMPDPAAETKAQQLQSEIAAQEQALKQEWANINQAQPWLQMPVAADAPIATPAIAHLSYNAETAWPERSENRLVEIAPEVKIADQVKVANTDKPLDATPVDATPVAGLRAVELSGDEAVNLEVGNFRRWQPFSISLWLWSPGPFERAVVLHRSRAWTDAGSRGYELLIEDDRLKFSLIHFWPGNAIAIQTQDSLPHRQWLPVTLTYDGSSRADGLQIFVNGQTVPTEVVRDHLTKQIAGGGGDNIAIGERFRDQGFKGGRVAEVRVFDRQVSPVEAAALARWDFTLEALAAARRQAWARPGEPGSATPESESDADAGGESESNGDADAADAAWSVDHRDALTWDWALNFSPEYTAGLKSLAARREALGNLLDQRREIMVMRELPTPKPTYFRERGEYNLPTKEMSPGVPEAVLPWFDDLPANRLGLARWTFDRRNPLTARVAVNRWWQLLFGDGLVRTPEDFGNQGQRPTHAALLDYLAVDFMDSGWDIKRLIRQMALSATYQQSVVATPATLELDPENRWWTRANSHRWPAETLRDQALAVAGLLDVRLDGPPVKPYDLAEAFAPLPADGGPLVYRRSLYTYWKRMSPSPVMITLDAVKRDVCQVKRERTETPGQSLVFLNAPQFVEASRALALVCWTESPEPAQAIVGMYQRMLNREPSDRERTVLLELFHDQLKRFQESPQQLEAYLQVGHQRLPAEAPATEIGALAVVANTLMGLDQWTSRR